MATRSSTKPVTLPFYPTPYTYNRERISDSWDVSPRKNGKLVLRSNRCNLLKQTTSIVGASSFSEAQDVNANAQATLSATVRPGMKTSSQNQAINRLRGKLYKGSAALGITLGTYSQSRDMIEDRYRTLNGDASRRISELSDDLARGRFKQGAKRFAGTHLEVIFGWQPLMSDIVAATTTVIQATEPQYAVTGRGSTRLSYQTGTGNRNHINGRYDISVSSLVRVTNPNLWMLERAGLLNPAAIAWDLVPWSFLVNMFVNINSFVNQVSEYAGLTFENQSTTETTTLTQLRFSRTDPAVYAVRTEKHKIRTLGSIPRPALEFKTPEMSWGTVAMAASLFTQKISLFQKLGTQLTNLSKKV